MEKGKYKNRNEDGRSYRQSEKGGVGVAVMVVVLRRR
jgi:hypothetical protein